MTTPTETDFIISQGDTLPVMRVVIPPNSAGQLVDLAGCDVVFHGRPVGVYTSPPQIIRPIQSFAVEVEDGVNVVAAYVKFAATDTATVEMTPGDPYRDMQGELEIVNPTTSDVLTVPTTGYLTWFIRDDIGDGGTV